MAYEKKSDKSYEKKPTDTAALAVEHILPQSIEAEQSVLGAMLLDRDALVTGEDILRADDFYREAHAIIFNAILSLAHKGTEVDILTVTEELRRMGRLDDVGGVMYVNELPEHCLFPKAVRQHAEIVADKSKLRRLINAANTIAASAYAAADDTLQIVDNAERQILEVSKDDRRNDFVPIGEAVQNELADINTKYQNKSGITGLSSGFLSLDSMTTGLQKGDFIIVAARPSMGKTAFVLNIAYNVAINAQKPVAFFSLEMPQSQLVQRLLSSAALIEGQKLRTGRLTTQEEWNNLAAAASVLMEAPLYIDDSAGVTVADIRSKSRRLKAEHGLSLIIIDYLQLMQSRTMRGIDNRQQEISDISRNLKSLARELDVPVIALSQLSRAVEARQDHRPMLSDLRESGSLEQDADMVAFLYREAYYNKELEADDARKNLTEVILAKNRNGPIGQIELYFYGQYTRFHETTNREEPEDF